jgi:hypothetical protein
MYITRTDVADEVSEAHGEVFRDVRPAATMVVVCRAARSRGGWSRSSWMRSCRVLTS